MIYIRIKAIDKLKGHWRFHRIYKYLESSWFMHVPIFVLFSPLFRMSIALRIFISFSLCWLCIFASIIPLQNESALEVGGLLQKSLAIPHRYLDAKINAVREVRGGQPAYCISTSIIYVLYCIASGNERGGQQSTHLACRIPYFANDIARP